MPEKETRVKDFWVLKSSKLCGPPSCELGSSSKGCAAVYRMSRHEGELICGSTEPGMVSTLPDQLAPRIASLTAFFQVKRGFCGLHSDVSLTVINIRLRV